jgi:hypothetical protein
MFVCSIELLSTLRQDDGEPTYFVVAKFNFDPGLQPEDELWVNWEVWDKPYNLKTKVLNRKKEVFAPDSKLKGKYGEEAAKNGLFMLRIFVEAEDRDAVVELCEAIERNNRMGQQ